MFSQFDINAIFITIPMPQDMAISDPTTTNDGVFTANQPVNNPTPNSPFRISNFGDSWLQLSMIRFSEKPTLR